MLGKSAHLQVIPQQAPKTQQICHYIHATKTRELFLLYNTGVDFSSSNNFANLGSFAKVSVPVASIIPWFIKYTMGSCLPNCADNSSWVYF